jgi:hypothetical protein
MDKYGKKSILAGVVKYAGHPSVKALMCNVDYTQNMEK